MNTPKVQYCYKLKVLLNSGETLDYTIVDIAMFRTGSFYKSLNPEEEKDFRNNISLSIFSRNKVFNWRNSLGIFNLECVENDT